MFKNEDSRYQTTRSVNQPAAYKHHTYTWMFRAVDADPLSVFLSIMPCSPVDFTDVSEDFTASILRIEEYATQEAGGKPSFCVVNGVMLFPLLHNSERRLDVFHFTGGVTLQISSRRFCARCHVFSVQVVKIRPRFEPPT